MAERSSFNLVEARVWKDPKVRALDPNGRLVWLWILTNRAANFSGVYELSVETASNDTGLSRKAVAESLALIEAAGMIRRDPDLGAVWVVKRMALECRSEAQWKGAARQIMDFEGASFWTDIQTLYPSLGLPSMGPSPIPSPGGTPGGTGGHDHADDHADDHVHEHGARDNGHEQKPKRRHSPAELAARHLADALGSSLNPCRKQVKALCGRGWTLEDVRKAVTDHAEPGLAPWDWTRRATGGDRPKRVFDQGNPIPEAKPPTAEELARLRKEQGYE